MKRFKILAIVLLLGVAALRFLTNESETPKDWKPLEPTRTIGEDGFERIGFDFEDSAPAPQDPA